MLSGFIQGLQLRVISGISQFPQSIGRLGPYPRGNIKQESFAKICEDPTITQLTQRGHGTLSHGRILICQDFSQRRIGTLGFKLRERFNRGTTAVALADGQGLREEGNDRLPGTDFPQSLRGSMSDGTVLIAQGSCQADGGLVVDVFPYLSQGPCTIFTYLEIGIG